MLSVILGAVQGADHIQISAHLIHCVGGIICIIQGGLNIVIQVGHFSQDGARTAREAAGGDTVHTAQSQAVGIISQIPDSPLHIQPGIFLAVGGHPSLEHIGVVAQILEGLGDGIAFHGVAAGRITAASNHNHIALGCQLVLHQIGHQEGFHIGVVIALGGKVGDLHRLGCGRCIPPDVPHTVGCRCILNQCFPLGHRIVNHTLGDIVDVVRVDVQQGVGRCGIGIPAFSLIGRGHVADQLVVIEFCFQGFLVVIGGAWVQIQSLDRHIVIGLDRALRCFLAGRCSRGYSLRRHSTGGGVALLAPTHRQQQGASRHPDKSRLFHFLI